MKTEKIQEVIDIIKTLPAADSANSNENVVSTIEAEQVYRNVIENRLNHCLSNLKAHVKDAVYVGSAVVWNGGHFSIPVYNSLLEAQEQEMRDWGAIVWQQIVRQMAIERVNPVYFNIATEYLMFAE